MRSRIPNFYLRLAAILGIAFSLQANCLKAQQNGHPTPNEALEGASNGDKPSHAVEDEVSDVIIHHVMDTHDWHLADIGETPIALHLPWILYNSATGLEFYGSTHALAENANYIESHDNVYPVTSKTPVRVFENVAGNEAEKAELAALAKENVGKYAFVHHKGVVRDHEGKKSKVDEVSVYEIQQGTSLIDFSLTKTGLQILIVAIVMFFLFTAVARAYKKREGMAPKGLQSFMEPLILFVRDDVAKPYLHGKHERFLPYFLTLFFFIWFSNVLGLTPLSSNIAGNTTITIMLAMLTMILIIANSTKDFWMHILWFPGVPIWMKPLMLVVELMGFFTKPAALAIRLFANISAGHFMVLALISLIFILGDNGHSMGGAITIMPLSVAFSLFIFTVELLVAAVQAFVFSLLTAVFIGQAMETHSHEEHGAEAHH